MSIAGDGDEVADATRRRNSAPDELDGQAGNGLRAWIAEVPTLPGVLCYGKDRDDAVAGIQALALRVLAERLEQREAPAEFLNVTFHAA